MKNKKIKSIALMLAAMMACTACGQTVTQSSEASKSSESGQESKTSSAASESSSQEQDEPAYFNETGYPIVNEEITIRVLTQDNAQATAFSKTGDAPVWDYLEEKFGVKFEFESYSKDDLSTKKALIFADPENMPDIFWQATLTEDEVASYGEQGLLLPLEDLIDKYGENIQNCWDYNDAYKGYATSVDGHVYALPSYNSNGTGSTFMVNDKWLKNCGIESYPTNLDEFKEMLIKFRDMDANGNGDPNDEIPLQGNTDSLVAILECATGMMGSWPYTGAMYSSDYGSTETYPIFMEERYRYVVEYMADLYKEGLVDSDMFTVTSDERNARRQSDVYGVLPHQTWPETVEKYDPNDWTAIPLMTSEYKSECTHTYAGPAYQVAMAAVSANTKYPEVVTRILDYMFSVDGTALFNAVNPTSYDLQAAGVSQEVIDILTKAWDGQTDSGLVGSNLYGTYGCRWVAATKLSDYKIQTGSFANNILKTVDENLRQPYTNQGKVITCYTYSLKFTSEESEVIAQYQTDIDTYIKDRLGQWLSGNEELTDDTWNAYIEKLKAMNVDKLTEAYQGAVNRWYGVE